MRLFVCHGQRMLRTLHGRWPFRRSHVRHDLHLLVQVHAKDPRCPAGRAHSRAALFPVGRGRARGG